MRWLLIAVLSGCLTLGLVGPGSASQDVQSDLLVATADGGLWLVRNGQRHGITPQVLAAEEIARWPESAPFAAQIPWVMQSEGTIATSPAESVARTPVGDAAGEWHRVARWQGNGDKNTEPFAIQGAQWRIVYTVRDPRSNTPRLCITVRTLDVAHVDGGCYRQDDTTYEYRRGTFYLDISSADQWTVAVEDFY